MIPLQVQCQDKAERWVVYALWLAAFLIPLQQWLGDICVLAALGGALYRQFRRKNMTWPKGGGIWLLLGFAGWSFLSTLQAPTPFLSQYSWFYNIFLSGTVFLLTPTYINTPQKQWQMVKVVLGAAFLVGLFGVYQYMYDVSTEMQIWVDAEQFPLLKRRMYSTLQNPNLLGEYLLFILSISGAWLLLSRRSKNWSTLRWLLPFNVFCLLIMLLTYSRGIWLSFACLVLFWAAVLERRLWFSLLVVPLVLFFYHGEIAARLWSLFDRDDTSVLLRWALWDSTSYMIEEHPVWGIGFDAFKNVYPEYNYYIQDAQVIIYHAHNSFLNVMAETGILGALTYFGSMLAIAGSLWRKKDRVSLLTGTATYGIVGMVLAVWVSGLSDHNLYSHQVSLIFWQLMGWGVAVVSTQQGGDGNG